MKIPLTPPDLNQLANKLYSLPTQDNDMFKKIISFSNIPYSQKYLHWDKLRHLNPPEDWSIEEIWLAIKFTRLTMYKPLSFTDKKHQPFRYATPDSVLQQLYIIDNKFGRSVQSTASILNTDQRDAYLVNSLIEEAITSSQLEGASTTREEAKSMLRSQRRPHNKSEHMIVNNYRAMQFVREMKNENLTIEMMFELHKIITENTLPNEQAGQLRTSQDKIYVGDERDNTILHTPPDAKELKQRLEKICNFANTTHNKESKFIHPVIMAIMLHFMLAYDHPFVDGNGRTARALFYWYLLKHDYWLIEFISISRILKNAPGQYSKAFLYTETDDNDITYFIIHQLKTIIRALDEFRIYLEKQMHEIKETETLLLTKRNLHKKLNYRQIALIKHALKHPKHRYLIEEHRVSHDITYDTARNDLLKLNKFKLFLKKKEGKTFVFFAMPDLKNQLKGQS